MLDRALRDLQRYLALYPAAYPLQLELALTLERLQVYAAAFDVYCQALKAPVGTSLDDLQREEALAGLQRVAALQGAICWPQDQSTMLFIPAGVFYMGNSQGLARERPLHKVYLDAYFIDQELITNQQFQLFMAAGGYSNPAYWSTLAWQLKSHAGWQGPRCQGPSAPHKPVRGISWYEAQAYCCWAGKSLPTEAQWEKLMRGGVWLDGDQQQRRANSQAQEVHLAVSPYGPTLPLCQEWCADWYDEHAYSRQMRVNPTGPTRGQYKSLRGLTNPDALLTRRFMSEPQTSSPEVGFRTMASLPALVNTLTRRRSS